MSSDLSGFFQQPFISSMMGFLCFFGGLLLVVMIFIIRARLQKADSTTTSPILHVNPNSGPADLPDLDDLVGAEAVSPVVEAPFTTQAQPLPEPVTAPTPPPAPTPISGGVHTLHLKDGGQAQAVEVMTILRDVVGGGLIVQIGDEAYRDLNSDETFRTGFLKIMRELSPNVKGGKPTPPAPTVAPVPPSPVQAPTPPKAQTTLPPVQTKGPLPGDLPKFESEPIPIKAGGGFFNRGPKVDAKPIPEIDIAGAIEAFLQHKLSLTPEYADRSIHVYPAPDGGVAISVDGELYESVGDVTDETVRQFLTETIQEWQSRN